MSVTKYLSCNEWKLLERLLTKENSLCVRVMLETGLRVSDVLNLRSQDVVMSNNLTVSESKTGKTKDIMLSDDLRSELLKVAGDFYVFSHRSYPDRHRTRQAVWMDIKRAKKAMRIKDNVSCHSARKTYAVQAWRDTHDLHYVQKLLNHDRAETTLIYLVSEFM